MSNPFCIWPMLAFLFSSLNYIQCHCHKISELTYSYKHTCTRAAGCAARQRSRHAYSMIVYRLTRARGIVWVVLDLIMFIAAFLLILVLTTRWLYLAVFSCWRGYRPTVYFHPESQLCKLVAGSCSTLQNR